MKVLATLAASLLASAALAAPVHRVEAPPASGFRLLATSEVEPPFWVPFEVREAIATTGINFIDITDFQEAEPSLAPKPWSTIPAAPSHQREIKALIPNIDAELYEKNLITFSNTFNNRYYTSDTGVQSAEWILERINEIVANRTDITVTKFTHSFKQPSFIVRIPGSSQTDEAVILGAHQDSTAPGMPNGNAPGADDDGSGSMGILEILRVLVEANFRPQLPLEFHWYAAEEVGLLGSQGVAQDYQRRNIPVRSMMQLDMIAYDKKESTVGIVTDFVDADTIQFSRQLIDEYLNIGWTNTVCGYGCSDHASWNRYGYRSCFPFEAQFRNRNPVIHTTMDTMSQVSIPHAVEFLKLGLSFAVELSYL